MTTVIRVKFFTLLRLQLGVEEMDVEADQINVRALLHRVSDELGNQLVMEKLLDAQGALQTGTIILVNGHDVFHMSKLDTIVSKGDTVSLFTPGGGG
ncbi:MAG: MoaD/ThiS family protein [Myxococcota bacterium]|jgi:molybdopterin converting factor small subunit|nr:MoaD/ThiS family protein [Myxococcota bacterium]